MDHIATLFPSMDAAKPRPNETQFSRGRSGARGVPRERSERPLADAVTHAAGGCNCLLGRIPRG